MNFRFLNYISIKTCTAHGHEHSCQSSPVDTNSMVPRLAPPDPASSGEESILRRLWPLAPDFFQSQGDGTVCKLQGKKGRRLDLFFFPFLIFYLFLERGEGKERDTDVPGKHQSAVSRPPPTGDLALKPGSCPDPGTEPAELSVAE